MEGAIGKRVCPLVMVVRRWPLRMDSGQVLVEQLLHLRLVIEGLHLRRRAHQVEVDAAFGLGREMRQAGESADGFGRRALSAAAATPAPGRRCPARCARRSAGGFLRRPCCVAGQRGGAMRGRPRPRGGSGLIVRRKDERGHLLSTSWAAICLQPPSAALGPCGGLRAVSRGSQDGAPQPVQRMRSFIQHLVEIQQLAG